MITRAIDAAYSGTRDVSQADRHRLRRYIRCARPRVHKRAMRRYLDRARQAWLDRRAMHGPALASYYNLHGGGACGVGDVQSGYRFASLFLACGTMVRMCHGVTCVNAQMSDHGPYVSGRAFDLNVNLRAALGCGPLCDVMWRVL